MANNLLTPPLYLARRSYRQRRLRDAARVLPIAGAILWLLPVVSKGAQTGRTGLYIFGVWVLLILIAAAISWRLRDEPDLPASATRPHAAD